MGFTGKPNVIPNGVDVEKFTQTFPASRRIEVRNTLGFIPEDRLLITTSRLSLKNGVDDLIRALTFLPVAYKALIVGEGEDRQKLESLVTELGLESRVKFVGKRAHDELPALLNASDVFVRPSLSEGLGNSFLEAMAAGIPIIGTPVGGIPDFLQDGVTGIFCRVRDPESIARAVERVQSDDAFREKMIQRARILVEDGYQWKTIARNMDTLMNRLGHSDIF
jgi:glycosyltransferase involved in cell wall biosynthesis